MADLNTSIVLSLKDQVTGTLGKIKESFAQFSEGAEKFKKSFELSGNMKLTRDAFKDLHEQLMGVVEEPKKLARGVDEAYGDLQRSSHLTGAAFQQLRGQLEAAGKGTRFDYQDLAESLTTLTKRTGDASVAMTQLKAIEALAEAGKLDLNQATQVTSMTMARFGDAAGNAATYADLIVKAAQVGRVSVGDMGNALSAAATQAHVFGANAEQTAGLLAAMTTVTKDAGQASSLVNTIFSHMAAPRGLRLATEGLERLGLGGDVRKRMQDLPKLLEDVNKATAGFDPAKRALYFRGIFGATELSQVTQIAGPGGLQALIKQMKDAEGASEGMAKSIGGSAAAAHERLEAAQKRLAETMGSSLVASGKTWDNTLARLYERLGTAAQGNETLVGSMMRVIGGVGHVAGAIATALPAIAALSGGKGLVGMLTAAKGLVTTLGPVAIAVAAVGAAAYEAYIHWKELKEAFSTTEGLKTVGRWVARNATLGLYSGETKSAREEDLDRQIAAIQAREAPLARGAGANKGQLGIGIHVDSEGKASVTKVKTTGDLSYDTSLTGLALGTP